MNFDQAIIEGLKKQLELEGYANDEQDFGLGHGSLGSYAFEHRRAEILADLQTIGYACELESSGRFFSGYGAIHWMFNPKMLNREDAEEKTIQWVQNSLNR